MRKWILRLHLYGGLICAPYFLVLGISSLRFNHRSEERSAVVVTRNWDAPLTVEPVGGDEVWAAAVRDSLGLIGWPVRSRLKRDASGDMRFDLETPGKSYSLQTDLADHRVHIEERRKSCWQVIDALHSTTVVPNSWLATVWGVFIELSTAFTLFAIGSGLYLWIRSRRERVIGIVALSTAVAISAGLMAYIALHG